MLFCRDIPVENVFKRSADLSLHGGPSGITNEQYANFEQRKNKTKTGAF